VVLNPNIFFTNQIFLLHLKLVSGLGQGVIKEREYPLLPLRPCGEGLGLHLKVF